MSPRHCVDFFDTQFRRQIAQGDFALNPFERLALEQLSGRVLDLRCGLGNLAVAAARRGCEVTAVDASPAAVAHLERVAAAEGLALRALRADFETWRIDGDYAAIAAIGLLMFFPRGRALALLDDIATHVRQGGRAIVNLLVEGTTFLDLFEPGNYTLFGQNELERWFASKGWHVPVARHDEFPAPEGRLKVFSTVVALPPATTS
jgi:tellurite methyltransferase